MFATVKYTPLKLKLKSLKKAWLSLVKEIAEFFICKVFKVYTAVTTEKYYDAINMVTKHGSTSL